MFPRYQHFRKNTPTAIHTLEQSGGKSNKCKGCRERLKGFSVHQRLHVSFSISFCFISTPPALFLEKHLSVGVCAPRCQDYSNPALSEEEKRGYQVPITAVPCLLHAIILSLSNLPSLNENPNQSLTRPPVGAKGKDVCEVCQAVAVLTVTVTET